MDDQDRVVFSGNDAHFKRLELGAPPLFTYGASTAIQFEERPMWLGYSQDEFGGNITLDMDDGNPEGQSIFISKGFLWELGVHRPAATHEDGTSLNVTPSEDRSGWYIDVPHFSEVILNPTNLSVLARTNGGTPSPHLGIRSWHVASERLEIDTGTQLFYDLDLFVEKDWIDMRVDYLGLQKYVWHEEEHNNIDYYVFTVPKSHTPTTAVMGTYQAWDIWTYTQGNPENVLFFENMMVDVDAQNGSVVIDHDPLGQVFLASTINVNATWLNETGVGSPAITVNDENVSTFAIVEGLVQTPTNLSAPSTTRIVQAEVGLEVPLTVAMQRINLPASSEDSLCQIAMGGQAQQVADIEDIGNTGQIWILGAEVCFEWSATLPDGGEYWSWYEKTASVAYSIWDPTTTAGCAGGTQNTEELSAESGWAFCTWEGSYATWTKYSLIVTAAVAPDADGVTLKSAVDCYVGYSTGALSGLAFIKFPPVAVVMAIIGSTAGAYLSCQELTYRQGGVLKEQIWAGTARTVTKQLLAGEGFAALPDVTYTVEMFDADIRRVDTYTLVENAWPLERPGSYDGHQRIEWNANNMDDQNGDVEIELKYLADISYLHGPERVSTSGPIDLFDGTYGENERHLPNLMIFRPTTGSFAASIEFRSSQGGIDWEAPSGYCLPNLMPLATFEETQFSMIFEAPDVQGAAVCGADAMFVPPVEAEGYPEHPVYDSYPWLPRPENLTDDWLRFAVRYPELGGANVEVAVNQTAFAQNNTTLFDRMIAAALDAQALSPSYQEFMDNLTTVMSAPPLASPVSLPIQIYSENQQCNLWEEMYLAPGFLVQATASALYGPTQPIVLETTTNKETLICFDPTALSVLVEALGIEVEMMS